MDRSQVTRMLVTIRPKTLAENSEGVSTAIVSEAHDHGHAHSLADELARKKMGDGQIVEIYRLWSSYEAEVKVTMKKDGE